MNTTTLDLSPYRGPSLTSLHKQWFCHLTAENVQAVAEHMRLTLAGGYFWAEYNEGFPSIGLRVDRRELRPAAGEPSGVAWSLQDGRSHITVVDSYGVWGMSSQLAEQPPWGDTADTDSTTKRKWSTSISWGRSASLHTLAYHIEHLVPSGHLTRWTVLPIADLPEVA